MQPPPNAHVGGRGCSSPRPASPAASTAAATACASSSLQLVVLELRRGLTAVRCPTSASRVEHAAGAQILAGERLVEATDRAQVQELLDRAACTAPPAGAVGDSISRRRGAAALVVVHDRLAAERPRPRGRSARAPARRRRARTPADRSAPPCASVALRAKPKARAPSGQPAPGRLGARGRVLEVALEVGPQSPAHGDRAARVPPTADGPARCSASALASSARALARPPGVSRALPVSRAQPLERVLQRGVREAPRASGSGSGSNASGRSMRSTNQLTGQPIHRSSDDGDHGGVAQLRQHALVAQKRPLCWRTLRGASVWRALGRPRARARGRTRRDVAAAHRAPNGLRARSSQETRREQVADVVHEQRASTSPRRRRRRRASSGTAAPAGARRPRTAGSAPPPARPPARPAAGPSHLRQPPALLLAEESAGRPRAGNTPSCRPHANRALTRRARSASGSSTARAGPPAARRRRDSSRSSAARQLRGARRRQLGRAARKLAQLRQRPPPARERARLVAGSSAPSTLALRRAGERRTASQLARGALAQRLPRRVPAPRRADRSSRAASCAAPTAPWRERR